MSDGRCEFGRIIVLGCGFDANFPRTTGDRAGHVMSLFLLFIEDLKNKAVIAPEKGLADIGRFVA
jgi:hypothetical protein